MVQKTDCDTSGNMNIECIFPQDDLVPSQGNQRPWKSSASSGRIQDTANLEGNMILIRCSVAAVGEVRLLSMHANCLDLRWSVGPLDLELLGFYLHAT